jgi:hypothetical protein
MLRHDVLYYAVALCDVARFSMILGFVLWNLMAWYGMVRYGMVQYGTVRTVPYGMAWYVYRDAV